VIIPYFTRKFIDKGAEVIVNITNDMWFGETKASKQHLVIALFRAIENRVPIVRSTNSGISAFINSVGEITSRETGLYVADTLVDTIYPPKIKTIYTQYGDLFGYLLIVIFLLLLLFRRRFAEK